jgi:hypothetical protein
VRVARVVFISYLSMITFVLVAAFVIGWSGR